MILSKDTDVFVILFCDHPIHNQNFGQVLNDTVHFIDVAVCPLELIEISGWDVSTAYAVAGCDCNPSFFGITHEMFLHTSVQQGRV